MPQWGKRKAVPKQRTADELQSDPRCLPSSLPSGDRRAMTDEGACLSQSPDLSHGRGDHTTRRCNFLALVNTPHKVVRSSVGRTFSDQERVRKRSSKSHLHSPPTSQQNQS